MPITQERLLNIIQEYDKLLAKHNSLIGAISSLLSMVGDRTDPVYGSLVLMVNNYEDPASLIEVEKHWFRRFGKVNDAQREYKRRRKARQEHGQIPEPSSLPKGPVAKKSFWDQVESIPEPEDEEGGFLDQDPEPAFQAFRAELSPEKAQEFDRSVEEALEFMKGEKS
jgi:hypothetical protein